MSHRSTLGRHSTARPHADLSTSSRWAVTILAASITLAYAPAHAGPISTHADVRAPVAALAIGAYSTARVSVASGSSGSHSATLLAPVAAVSLGPGTTASVSIASSTRYSHSYVGMPVAAVSTWRSVSVRM